jgi:hypothetical protein
MKYAKSPFFRQGSTLCYTLSMEFSSFISPQNIFFLVLFLAIAVYWIFVFTIFYHLTRFGIGTEPKKFAVLFLVGSVALFFLSFILFSTINYENIIKNIPRIGQFI